MTAMTLRDDSTTLDPRLDRIPQFDDRSRNYPIRTLLGAEAYARPRSYHWKPGPVLDQGREGACVGFAFAGELAARPAVVKEAGTDAYALGLYRRAQQLDPWPGEAPTYHGTSVLAGAQAVVEKSKMTEFRWAFGLEDVVATLGRRGPIVLGVRWYSGMYVTDADGFVTLDGSLVGGHAILARGLKCVWLPGRTTGAYADLDVDRSYVTWRNSWGLDYGNGGDGKIRLRDLDRLLREDGEACVPVVRRV